jgi:hypothetical protein
MCFFFPAAVHLSAVNRQSTTTRQKNLAAMFPEDFFVEEQKYDFLGKLITCG